MQVTTKKRKTYNTPGDAHELTFSCYRRLGLLSQEAIKQVFIEYLQKTRERFGFEIWAYVIMPNHVHLLIWPTKELYDIAEILKFLKEGVSKSATRHFREHRPELLDALRVVRPSGRLEHRFWQQGGGYDRNLWTPKAIHSSIEYIHNNPVEAGLVEVATDWRWSSARWYSGLDDVVLDIDPSRMVATR